ncbi:hypothetical protein [Lysinibacillus sphaericus]|uniref:hypothetical protein n=1 Tax=Lysinibacillus sphaericus TaxID=1421 RepID=UPI0018CFB4DD|nr:hypothetical protein [Lysinibacillus sphaericus]
MTERIVGAAEGIVETTDTLRHPSFPSYDEEPYYNFQTNKRKNKQSNSHDKMK